MSKQRTLQKIYQMLPQSHAVLDHLDDVDADIATQPWPEMFYRLKGFLRGLQCSGALTYEDFCDADALLEELRDE